MKVFKATFECYEIIKTGEISLFVPVDNSDQAETAFELWEMAVADAIDEFRRQTGHKGELIGLELIAE